MVFQTCRTYFTKVFKCKWLHFEFLCCLHGHASWLWTPTSKENALLILVFSEDQCMKGSNMVIISFLCTVTIDK